MKRFLYLCWAIALFIGQVSAQQRLVQGLVHPVPLSDKEIDQPLSLRADQSFTFDDIKYWVGKGQNRAALVIEWHDGNDPDAIVWGYRWNGNASGLDMISAIAEADPRLIFLRQHTGPMGSTINGLGYNCPVGSISYDLEGAKTDPRVSFKFQPPYKMSTQTGHPATPEEDVRKALADGYQTGVIDHPFNAHLYGYPAYDYDYWKCSSGTHWDAGWYEGYWSYWVRDSQTDDFTYSGLGASSRQLVDGSWDGWSYLRDMTVWTGAELGDSFTAAVDPNAKPVTGVALSQSAITIHIPNTYRLTYTITPTDADIQTVTWESSEQTVATVNNQGLVTAVAPGKAMITVKTDDGGFTATCEVIVTQAPVPVKSVSLDVNSLTLEKGDKKKLTATVLPSEADNKGITWHSSEQKVATVNEQGLVTAVAKGQTKITVKTDDGGFTAICEVTVTDPFAVTGVTLDETELILSQGQTKKLTATVTPPEAKNKNVTWRSSSKAIATVNDQGLVTAVAKGKTKITVKTDDGEFTAICEVTVTDPFAVTGVTLDETELVLSQGQTKKLTATVTPPEAKNKKVAWRSSNKAIATVNDQGLVTAIMPGRVNIVVETDEGEFMASCKLTVTKTDPLAVTGVALNETELTLSQGQTQKLTATITPSEARNKNVTWRSSNKTIASINEQGVVTAISPGTTKITVETEEGGFTASCNITVAGQGKQPQSTFVNDTTVTLTFEKTASAVFYKIDVYLSKANKEVLFDSFRLNADGTPVEPRRGSAIDDLSFTVKGLKHSSKYVIKMYALNAADQLISAYAPLELTTPTSNMPEISDGEVFVSGNTLRLIGMARHTCSIYSISGVLIHQFEVGNPTEYRVLDLPAGVYLLHVVGQKHTLTRKFIIH
ncbi:Ig-like domain-containing protein [Tannerella forsythia]|uniref:T9SS C-terminal target domain-containing protein n=1 Tax=Tannerella forsythia TaxID=28112 RepID=A0A3P1XWB1_TANFO|nr:Ig-like domain-containing protein [Tannerella forsythia]RRD63122.1 T9SS C-terminal target domain-containing protein [Tannerella forsythia]